MLCDWCFVSWLQPSRQLEDTAVVQTPTVQSAAASEQQKSKSIEISNCGVSMNLLGSIVAGRDGSPWLFAIFVFN